MTIPLIVLLVALGLLGLLGLAVIAAGFLTGDGEALAAGLTLSLLATGCIAIVAVVTYPSAPTCRLSPASLAEKATP